MTSRRQSRRQAPFLVYQWDLSEGEVGAQYGGEIDPWARELADETVAQAAELDARITAASESWAADRLGAVERSALRVEPDPPRHAARADVLPPLRTGFRHPLTARRRRATGVEGARGVPSPS